MRHRSSNVLAATMGTIVAAGLWSHAAEAAVIAPERASIVVRTYTQPDAVGAVQTARRTASTILERAGIEVVWLECGEPAAPVGTAADACARALRQNELVVRMLPAVPVESRSPTDTLGFAFVDLKTGGGWLATVYTDRVWAMAEAAGTDRAELLGRTIAHEIGHLLIGTSRHARHGLMRASWSGADLRRNRATEWLFGGEEAAIMRHRVTSRAPHLKTVLGSANRGTAERLLVAAP